MANTSERVHAISVIMPVLNAVRYLPESIGALVAAMEGWPNAELIVVDNGSSDGSVEWLQRQAFPRLRLLSYPGVTIGELRNQGASVAGGEYLSFLDADCVIAHDYFQKAMVALASSGADAVGCYYHLPARPTTLEKAWDGLHAPRTSGFVRMLNAGNFLIRRSAFEKAGGFNVGLITGEDAELGLRLEQLGLAQFESPDMIARHTGNPKT